MMTEGWLKKLMGDLPSLITVAGALIALGIWVGNLKNQVDNSQQEVAQLKGQVTQLQSLLEKTQSGTVAAVKGPQGPKGEQGDPGPRGERGPKGDDAEVNQAIEQIIERVIRLEKRSALEPANRQAAASAPIGGTTQQSSPASSDCYPLPVDQTSGTFVLAEGARVCGPSGEFLAILEIRSETSLRFTNGGRYVGCSSGSPCDFFRKTRGVFMLDKIERAANSRRVATFSAYVR